MTHVRYPNPPSETEGHYLQYVDEQYLQTEVSPANQVILWSSQLDLPGSIAQFRAICGPPSPTGTGTLITEHDVFADEFPSADAEEYALKDPENVIYYSGHYGSDAIRLTWRRPQVKMQGGKYLYSELTASAPQLPYDVVAQVVGHTATGDVQKATRKRRSPLRHALGRLALVQ